MGGIVNELGHAGAHALTQGAFSALRGGNFWQGAAAGLFSSFGGSVSGAFGVTGFFGTVAVTSAMGGVGAAIGGARSTEDILFGMAAGAMVGALNFAEHEIEEKISLDKAIFAAGFNPDDVARWTNAELTSNMAKIFPEMYKDAGNPSIISTSDELPSKNGGLVVGQAGCNISEKKGVYSVTSTGIIKIRSFTLASIRWAASVVGHELNHAIDNVNGNYANWINKTKNIDQARYRSEVGAYGWEISVGYTDGGVIDQYNHFKSLIK